VKRLLEETPRAVSETIAGGILEETPRAVSEKIAGKIAGKLQGEIFDLLHRQPLLC